LTPNANNVAFDSRSFIEQVGTPYIGPGKTMVVAQSINLAVVLINNASGDVLMDLGAL